MPRCPCCGNETKRTEFSIEKKDFDKVKVIGMSNRRPVPLSYVHSVLGEVASVLEYDNQKRCFTVKPDCNDRVMVRGTKGLWASVSKLIEKHNSLADKMSKLKEEKKPAKLEIEHKDSFSRKSSPNERLMMQQKEREPYEDMIKLLKNQKSEKYEIEKQKLTTLMLQQNIRKLQQELYMERTMVSELKKKINNEKVRHINFLLDDIQYKLNRRIGPRNNIPLNYKQEKNFALQQPIVRNKKNDRYDQDDFNEVFSNQANIALNEVDEIQNIDFGDFDQFVH